MYAEADLMATLRKLAKGRPIEVGYVAEDRTGQHYHPLALLSRDRTVIVAATRETGAEPRVQLA